MNDLDKIMVLICIQIVCSILVIIVAWLIGDAILEEIARCKASIEEWIGKHK